MKTTNSFLTLGLSIPFIYFFSLILFGYLYPDYNHIQQVPSELGAINAPYLYAGFFNLMLVMVGLFSILSSIGVYNKLRFNGLSHFLPISASITLVFFGLSFVFFGFYPLPDERHGWAFFPMLGGVITPLFGGMALKKLNAEGRDWKVILAGFILSFILALFIFDFFALGLIGNGKFGLWIRIFALVNFSLLGYLCWSVKRLKS